MWESSQNIPFIDIFIVDVYVENRCWVASRRFVSGENLSIQPWKISKSLGANDVERAADIPNGLGYDSAETMAGIPALFCKIVGSGRKYVLVPSAW